MNLVRLALRNLRRRPVRTGLSVLGIAVAVGSALALLALSRSIHDGAQEGLAEIGGDLIIMPKSRLNVFGGFIPEKTIERIAAVHGVAAVSGDLVMIAPGGGGNILAFGWPGTSELWKKIPLREGRVPAPGESRVAVLGDAAAAALEKKLNDGLRLFGDTFRIVGIARYNVSVNRGAVVVPLADLQLASYRPRQVTIAHVSVADTADRTELSRIMNEIEAPGDVVAAPPAEVPDRDRNLAILGAVSFAVAIIAAAMSALNVITALAMATQERAREIGIFLAIGWSSGRIVESIVIEGLLLCAIGCGLGVLMSIGVAYAAPYIPVIGHLISLRPGMSLIAPVVGATFVLCALGALLPAWRAARMLPAEALRRI
jgi:putative ABC transport system permease protein